VVLTSDPRSIEADDRLFRGRLEQLVASGRLTARPLRRFSLDGGEAGLVASPIDETRWRYRLLGAYAGLRRRLRPVRRFVENRRLNS
jgi:hypothetical protein